MTPAEKLSASVRELLQALGIPVRPVSITITLKDGRHFAMPVVTPSRATTDTLRQLIFETLANQGPLAVKVLAARCGYSPRSGSFRSKVATLRDAGDLKLLADGSYDLAD
jgi:hypothetical protein